MTVFERIIAREIPATIEYEDDDVIAIRDIAPVAPVHILIIPKQPIPSIAFLSEEHQILVGKVFIVAKNLAAKFDIQDGGYRVVTNVNSDAGQTVFHLHFHLLGGEPLGAMTQSHQASESSRTPGPAPLPPSPARSIFRNTLVRETAIFVLAAAGLALGFNQLNSKRIAWLKPQFERIQATDSLLFGNTQPNVSVNDTMQLSSSETKPADAADKMNEQPNSISDVNSEKAGQPQSKTQTHEFVPQPGKVLEISLSQFERLLSDDHYLIDARTPETYAKGRIRDAVNVYGGEVESRIQDLLAMVPRDKPILVYCDGGECELSHLVANTLTQFGYGPIYIFTGGWAEWSKRR